MSTPEESSDRLLKAITDSLDGGMVTGFVVLASFMDDEGDRRVYCNAMQDQRCHETLGLLSWGLAIEQRRAALAWEESD